MWDLTLRKVLLEMFRFDRKPFGGDNAPFIHGVLRIMPYGDHFVVGYKIGKIEACDPFCRVDRRVQSPCKVVEERLNFRFLRYAMKPTNGDVDRVHSSATEHFKKEVPDLFEPESALNFLWEAFGQFDAAVAAKEIGNVQQIDVDPVAFDPLAAIKQSPQISNLREIVNCNAFSSAWMLVI